MANIVFRAFAPFYAACVFFVHTTHAMEDAAKPVLTRTHEIPAHLTPEECTRWKNHQDLNERILIQSGSLLTLLSELDSFNNYAEEHLRVLETLRDILHEFSPNHNNDTTKRLHAAIETIYQAKDGVHKLLTRDYELSAHQDPSNFNPDAERTLCATVDNLIFKATRIKQKAARSLVNLDKIVIDVASLIIDVQRVRMSTFTTAANTTIKNGSVAEQCNHTLNLGTLLESMNGTCAETIECTRILLNKKIMNQLPKAMKEATQKALRALDLSCADHIHKIEALTQEIKPHAHAIQRRFIRDMSPGILLFNPVHGPLEKDLTIKLVNKRINELNQTREHWKHGNNLILAQLDDYFSKVIHNLEEQKDKFEAMTFEYIPHNNEHAHNLKKQLQKKNQERTGKNTELYDPFADSEHATKNSSPFTTMLHRSELPFLEQKAPNHLCGVYETPTGKRLTFNNESYLLRRLYWMLNNTEEKYTARALIPLCKVVTTVSFSGLDFPLNGTPLRILEDRENPSLYYLADTRTPGELLYRRVKGVYGLLEDEKYANQQLTLDCDDCSGAIEIRDAQQHQFSPRIQDTEYWLTGNVNNRQEHKLFSDKGTGMLFSAPAEDLDAVIPLRFGACMLNRYFSECAHKKAHTKPILSPHHFMQTLFSSLIPQEMIDDAVATTSPYSTAEAAYAAAPQIEKRKK